MSGRVERAVGDDLTMADEVKLKRVADGPRTVRSAFRRVRRYEVTGPAHETRVLTLYQLDTLLHARMRPADFWACVDAADAAYAAGDPDVLIEWPTGRRTDHA